MKINNYLRIPKSIKLFILVAGLACSLTPNTSGQKSLAIPGALGFGKYVRGAYAGSTSPTILRVDTLTDKSICTGDNRGSFRWALNQDKPRIVIFEVSGYINLKKTLRVTHPYLSIYGQTAPGKGVTITGSFVDIRTSQVLIQHLRFRLNSNSGDQEDAFTIYEGSDVFIDHCSFSFALDENIGVANTFSGPLTISNCILSHPLHKEDSKGILMHGFHDSTSVIRNAFIHCAQRSPYIKGYHYKSVEILNNICYNPHYYGIMFSGGIADSKENTSRVNIIGNQLIPGDNTQNTKERYAIRLRKGTKEGVKFYIKDNICPRMSEGSEWKNIVKIDSAGVDSSLFCSSTPFNYTPLEDIYPASELISNIKQNAGAFYWNRDTVDSVAIYDMLNKTGNWLTDNSEAFYPSIPELKRKLSLPANCHLDNNGNGFTNFEDWLFNLTNKPAYNVPTYIKNPTDSEKNKIQIFPNPAKSEVNIRTKEYTEIKIYDMNGKLYYQNKISGQVTIPIKLPSGSYIVHAISQHQIESTQKLVIID
jgi:hypothetical protein